MLHIPLTNLLLLAAKQEPHKKSLSLNEKFRETFNKRYVAERTNKVEMRLENQSEKVESCQENLWNEIQLEGP